MSVFFAPVVRSRAYTPSFRTLDSRFAQFFNDATYGLKVDQDEKSWTVSLDMPGVSREDINISIEDAVVRIETRAEAARQYKAAYELPQDIDADVSSAKLENGVLTLTLVKLVPVSKARKVEVK